jgi:hypothetical protein
VRRSRALIAAGAAGAAATAGVLAVGPATAAPPVSRPIAQHLAGPLQLDVAKRGVYISEGFAGLLTRVDRHGHVTHPATGQDGISGAAVRYGQVAFATTGGTQSKPLTQLKLLTRSGKVQVIANLSRFEKRHNPDSVRSYGFHDLSASCRQKVADQFPDDPGHGGPYHGVVDSHPYSVANAPGGGWYVAEAAGNDILRVTPGGRIHVVYLAQRQLHLINGKQAKAAGLPGCVAGHSYAFEPVPTDVEVTRDGRLVVSQLPGGPEGPALGARGSVVKVNPWKGTSHKLAGGFAGATNVAVGPHGEVYVAQLFGNKISVIRPDGAVRKVADVPTPAALAWGRGKLFAAIDVFNQKQGGRVVTITP